tara:strand:- start:896 stop:1108 length:213 start_codon:yes stop_codon:yes gene_type:complete
MEDTGLKVETYVQPNTLANSESEDLEFKVVCTREGREKMDAKAANVMNIDAVTARPRELMDGINKTKQQY